MDATHVKARANSKKMRKRIADEGSTVLRRAVKRNQQDREAHGKKPLKERRKIQSPPPVVAALMEKKKNGQEETMDQRSGWFRKGEHKNVFAYSVQTACDKTDGFWVIIV